MKCVALIYVVLDYLILIYMYIVLKYYEMCGTGIRGRVICDIKMMAMVIYVMQYHTSDVEICSTEIQATGRCINEI